MDVELFESEHYVRDKQKWLKKHRNEFLAMLVNLEHYLEMLRDAKNERCVQAGFLRPEPHGVIAISQWGARHPETGKKLNNLKESRLYTYVHAEGGLLHLICIGDKNSQQSDIRTASR